MDSLRVNGTTFNFNTVLGGEKIWHRIFLFEMFFLEANERRPFQKNADKATLKKQAEGLIFGEISFEIFSLHSLTPKRH